MSEIAARLEAVIRDIETRTPRECQCVRLRVHEPLHTLLCEVRHDEAVRGEIARTVERIGQVMASYDDEGMSTHERSDAAEEAWWTKRWAAALRSASPEGT